MALLDFITSKKPEDVERRLRLAQAMSGMSLRPNVGLQEAIAGRLQGIESQRQKQAAAQAAEVQRNKTAQWLMSQNRADLAQGILTGSLTGQQAFDLFKQQPKDERTALQKNYEYAVEELGMEQKDAAVWAKAGGTVINMNPTIPAGYQGVYNDAGKLVRVEPIAGTKEAVARAAAEKAEAAKVEGTTVKTDIVLEDIGRLKTLVKEQGFLGVEAPVTGITGKIAGMIPGTAASDAEALATTIRSNIGFDRLQQMREESPTGGALGNVTERELSNLQAVLGSISLSQSDEQLTANLDRLEELYTQILAKAQAYPNASKYGFGVGAATQQDHIPTWNPNTGKFE